tara:strand:+ start:707 stop:1000 length:294 start_codon:yes stop_codon:yes gene_type:complete
MTEDQKEDCSICLSELRKKQKIVKLSCNHYFHLDCINEINSNACPLCRCKIIIDADICNQQHYSHFTVSNFLKNGTCRICLKKKSFKDCLKNKLVPI